MSASKNKLSCILLLYKLFKCGSGSVIWFSFLQRWTELSVKVQNTLWTKHLKGHGTYWTEADAPGWLADLNSNWCHCLLNVTYMTWACLLYNVDMPYQATGEQWLEAKWHLAIWYHVVLWRRKSYGSTIINIKMCFYEMVAFLLQHHLTSSVALIIATMATRGHLISCL